MKFAAVTYDTGMILVSSEHYEWRVLLLLGFLQSNSTRSLVDNLQKYQRDPARIQMTKVKYKNNGKELSKCWGK